MAADVCFIVVTTLVFLPLPCVILFVLVLARANASAELYFPGSDAIREICSSVSPVASALTIPSCSLAKRKLFFTVLLSPGPNEAVAWEERNMQTAARRAKRTTNAARPVMMERLDQKGIIVLFTRSRRKIMIMMARVTRVPPRPVIFSKPDFGTDVDMNSFSSQMSFAIIPSSMNDSIVRAIKGTVLRASFTRSGFSMATPPAGSGRDGLFHQNRSLPHRS